MAPGIVFEYLINVCLKMHREPQIKVINVLIGLVPVSFSQEPHDDLKLNINYLSSDHFQPFVTYY